MEPPLSLLQIKNGPAYEPKTAPFDHQLNELVEHAMEAARAVLWEQGTGKTKELIDQAAVLIEAGEIDAVVVCAPNGVHRNWKSDELPAHLPERLWPRTQVEFWEPNKANGVRYKAKFKNLLKHKGIPWLLMSYDGLVTKNGKNYLWKFLRERRVLYILDESHHIKSPGAKRTKSIVASGVYAPYRRIASGTPVTQGPFDIYSQIKFLDENFWKRHGFANFTVFKFHFGEWFTADDCKRLHGYDPGFDKLMGYKNLEQLTAILETISSRVLKEDVLDLPPKLYSKRYFTLNASQAEAYDKLRQEYELEFADGAMVDGQLAIVRLLRLQQIACGYAVTDHEEEPFRMLGNSNPLLDSCVEVTEALPHQSIIWARFRKDIDLIIDAVGADKCVRYDGTLSDDECARSKAAFQAGDRQHFVGNPAKGSEGLTLLGAKTVQYYNNSFKLKDRLQSEDRPHRIGQDVPVNYIDHDALMPDGGTTVINKVIRALRNKFDIASQINGDVLREWI